MKVASNSSSHVPHRHPEMVDNSDQTRKVWAARLCLSSSSQSVNSLLLPEYSHPLLSVKPGELTPGISTREYESRRRRLMETLPDNSLVVLMGGKVKYMSNRTCIFSFLRPVCPHHVEVRDIVCHTLQLPPSCLPAQSSYKFRQASDFWYLTGFDEPDAAVILGLSHLPYPSTSLNLPLTGREDQFPTRVQNVAILIRYEP
jgi:hypothetical protein